MDNPVTPPSLIGAGVATQPQPPQSMIGVLRSQGSLPAQAMQQMAPQTNPGLAAGSGMLAALGGQPGANPYLAQQAQQAAQQQTQQYHMAAIAQKAQQARQAQEAKRQEALLKVSQELLQGDNEDGRLVGAKGLQAYSKSVGLQIPESVVQGLATKRLTPAQYNDVLKRVGMGYDDAAIISMYPNLKAKDLTDIKQAAKSPAALKAVGLQTPTEAKLEGLKLQHAEAQAVIDAHPELHGDAALTQATIMMYRKQHPGKDLKDGSDEEITAAYDAAVKQKEAREDAKARQSADLQTQKMLAGIDARLAAQSAQGGKPMTPAQQLQMSKQIEPLKKRASTLEMIDKISSVVDAIPDAAMPKGIDLASQMSAKMKRELLYRGDDNIVNFQQLWGPLSVGQIDRGMFDEKGVRSIQAFQKQLSVVDNMPPKAALKNYLKTIREHLIRAGDQNLREAGMLGYRPEVIDVMRDVWAPYGNPGKAPSPLKPNLPPGTHLEGGKLISDDNKNEWDGAKRQWIPRTQ